MGKVHWHDKEKYWPEANCSSCGKSQFFDGATLTRDPAKVTCKHPACQKAKREAEEK